jgi:hypothetical protein
VPMGPLLLYAASRGTPVSLQSRSRYAIRNGNSCRTSAARH